MRSPVLVALLLTAFLAGCLTNIRTISSRPIGFEKEGTNYVLGNSHIPGAPGAAPEIYVKQRTLKIEPTDRENLTGSLFVEDDKRNYLFLSDLPSKNGDYIDVQIVSNRTEPEKPDDKKAKAKEKPEQQIADDELLKALPSLEPNDKSPSLLKSFQMEITHKLGNGDLLLSYKRQSSRGANGKDMLIKARIPYQAMTERRALTTKDLRDVEWLETERGDVITRNSTGWEDEYTVRLSGFTEAQSKEAYTLEEKRKQLQTVRDKLATEIRNVGKERNQMSGERDKWRKDRQDDAARVAELQKKVDEQQEEIGKYKPAETESGDEATKGKKDSDEQKKSK